MEYSDLIYYKQDVVDEYYKKRKNLEKEDIEDLLRCAFLFLEDSVKGNNTSFEIPNIGFLHKKIDLSKLVNISSSIKEEDNFLIGCAYLDITFSPLIMRKELVEQYYPDLSLQDIQAIQVNK